MQRRQYLATLPAVALAGCLFDADPDTQSQNDATSASGDQTIPRATPNDNGVLSPGEIRYNLENLYDFDVTVFRWDQNEFQLEFIGSDDELEKDVVRVSNVYTDYVETDGEATRLNGTILDPFEDPIAEFYLERDWAERYLSDDVTEREYITQMLETVSYY